VTWPRPFQKHFVIRRLGLAMFNPHTKFEMSTIICNEEMKGHAKCKNFCFEPPFGDLGVTYTAHLWLAGKRVVDFLLVLIEFFSPTLMAAALLSEICRNRRFPTGVGHFERNAKNSTPRPENPKANVKAKAKKFGLKAKD